MRAGVPIHARMMQIVGSYNCRYGKKLPSSHGKLADAFSREGWSKAESEARHFFESFLQLIFHVPFMREKNGHLSLVLLTRIDAAAVTMEHTFSSSPGLANSSMGAVVELTELQIRHSCKCTFCMNPESQEALNPQDAQ